MGKLRARPKESATFLYTAIFFGATLSDGGVKKQRRSHWDDAIQKAKEEVVAKEREVERRKEKLGLGVGDRVDGTGPEVLGGRMGVSEELTRRRHASGAEQQGISPELRPDRKTVNNEEDALSRAYDSPYARSHTDDAILRAREELEAKFLESESSISAEEKANEEKEELDDDFDDEHPNVSQAEAAKWNNSRFIHEVVKQDPGQPPEYRSFKARNITPEDVMRYAIEPGAERPPWTPNTSIDPTSPNHMEPQSLWSSDVRREKWARRLWTPKKMTLTEVAVAKAVVQMFILAKLSALPPSQLLTMPEAVRDLARLPRAEQESLVKDLEYEIQMVHGSGTWERLERPYLGIPLPNYNQSEDGSHIEIARDLNDSILSLTRAYKQSDIPAKALIAKLGNNLMVSPVPPDLHTFNIILIAFRDNHRRLNLGGDSKEGIIDYWIEVMRCAVIRPNELTCACILSSYRKRGLADEFALFVTRMRGHKRALMLARPDIRITAASKGRLNRDPLRPDKVYQAVHPSTMVYWELIKGVLKFSGIEQAVAICRNFGEAAWGMDWDCLFELLLGCYKARDWDSGMIIWEQVESFSTMSWTPYRVRAVMLALCVACGQKQKFEDLMRNMTKGDETSLPKYAHWALQIISKDERAKERGRYDGYVRVNPDSFNNTPWSWTYKQRRLLDITDAGSARILEEIGSEREPGELSTWESVDQAMSAPDWAEKAALEDGNSSYDDEKENFWDGSATETSRH
jgi:hypothetical protein